MGKPRRRLPSPDVEIAALYSLVPLLMTVFCALAAMVGHDVPEFLQAATVITWAWPVYVLAAYETNLRCDDAPHQERVP